MAILAGDFVIYTVAFLQLMFIGRLSLVESLTVGVFPFLPAEALKLLAASTLALSLRSKVKL